MGASFSDRFYIAAPQGVAAKLSSMLLAAQIMPSGVVHTGMEAVRAAQGGAMLLTTYRLPDMTGEELARQLGEEADVVMIVPQDYAGEETENVVMLRNPISADALVQSVKTLAHCRIRMQQLRAKAEKLSRTLEERKLIDRAKGKLMDVFHLTESEAHYKIQKTSMDSGRRIADVAREILESSENMASYTVFPLRWMDSSRAIASGERCGAGFFGVLQTLAEGKAGSAHFFCLRMKEFPALIRLIKGNPQTKARKNVIYCSRCGFVSNNI
ncbi:MAG: ANTAR domain-containing protein [Christensenellales bacterium]|nr:ANTAR domain-containing protein [Christensenellales bacterium]